MASATTPDIRPTNPNFSSGPCAKRPGFTLDALSGAFLGRSHRAAEPKARLAEVISLSKSILGMPADWRLGIVPASDTGAVEMVLWSMLGARGVDILTFESFGEESAGWRGRARHAGVVAARCRAVGDLYAAAAVAENLSSDVERKAVRGRVQGRNDQHAVDEDALDGLRWAERIGGLRALIARSEANLAAVAAWVERSDWAAFLADEPATRSCTSICLKITAPWFTALPADGQAKAAKQLASLLEKQGVAYDIGGYRDAPPGLRIWAGATVETSDVKALLPWLDWAASQVAGSFEPA
jgi:phosphoserine aminotransferase